MVAGIRETFKTKEQVSPEELEQGLRAVVYDGVCTQSMVVLTSGTFLVAFALALGASNFHIGLLAAIPFFAQILQIPAVFLVEKVRARRGLNLIFSGFSRLFLLPIVAIPLIFAKDSSGGLYLLIIAFALSAGLGAIGGTSWNSWMRDLIPQCILGRFFSKRMMVSTAAGLVLTIVAGVLANSWSTRVPGSQLWVYSVLFLVGTGIGLFGLNYLWRTPEPDMGKKVESPSLKSLLSQPLRDANFRRLLKFSVSWNFAINLAIPFFTVYLLRRLGYSLTFVVILSVLSQVANILSLRVWGKLSDRFSNKSILLVSGPLLLLSILAWPFTMMPDKYFLTLPLVVIINILSGLSLAGVTLGTTNIALKLSPRGCATSYLATSGFLNSLSAGVASLIGGAAGLFVASKELLLRFGWAGISDRFGIHALRLQGLDFLFVIAFVIGVYSMYCLTKVAEEGEVKERVFIGVLTSAMVQQIKSMSTMSGLRALASLPLHIIRDSLRRVPLQHSRRKGHAT